MFDEDTEVDGLHDYMLAIAISSVTVQVFMEALTTKIFTHEIKVEYYKIESDMSYLKN